MVVADQINKRLAMWHLRLRTVWKHLGAHGPHPLEFNGPMAVAVTRAGTLVVSDDCRVQVLTIDGDILCVMDPTVLLTWDRGSLGRALRGFAVCAGTDELLVTDHENDCLVALAWSPTSLVPAYGFFQLSTSIFLSLCLFLSLSLSLFSHMFHSSEYITLVRCPSVFEK